jgi:hypothetical protein
VNADTCVVADFCDEKISVLIADEAVLEVTEGVVAIVPFLNRGLVNGSCGLEKGVMVEIITVVEKMVLELSTVVAGMIVVELKTFNVVKVLKLVETGGVVVIVVKKVVKTGSPHPAGIMDGPPAKHDAKPEYWAE